MKHLSILLLFVGLLSSSSAYAGWSHGGDIKWEPLNNDSFKVIATVYRDCNGINVGTARLSLVSNCGSQTAWPTAFSSRDITPVCSSVSTRCTGKTPFYTHGIQQFEMTYLVSMADWKKNGCCKVEMNWSVGNRSSGITTGGQNNRIYIHGEMSLCGSPVAIEWVREPRAIVCLGKDLSLKNFSITTDSTLVDSVVYSWAEPLQTARLKTTWNSPYSYNKPIYFLGFPKETRKFPQGLHLDSNSGRLQVRPMKEETTILKVKASIYRNGIWQGSVYRDQVLMVVKCPDNEYPKLSAFDCKSSITPLFPSANVQKVICGGDSTAFTICTSDKNKRDSVTLSYEHHIPGLSVTIDKSTPTREKAIVSWKTTAADIREEPYKLIVRANDNSCPVVGEDFQVYELYVKKAAQFKIDIEDQGCGNYEYTAVEQDSATVLGTYWSINYRGTSHSLGVFSDTVHYRHSTPGYSRFRFNATIGGFCPYTFTDSVLVKDNFLRVDIGLDSLRACIGNTAALTPKTFNAQGPTRFLWKDANDSLLSTSTSPKFQIRDSSFHVFVTADDGTCDAYDEVRLAPFSNPEITLPKVVYACSGDSANALFTVTTSTHHDTISSIKWTDHTQSIVLSDSAKLNTRTEGKYFLQITTQNGCEILDSVAVSFYDPEFKLIGDTAACIDDNLTYSATSGQFGYYQWFVGGEKLNSARLQKSGANISFRGQTSEKVRLQFRGTEHGLNCPKVKFVELQIHPKPVFNVVHPSALCQGDSVLLTSSSITTWRMADRTQIGTSVWYKANDVRANNAPYITNLLAAAPFGCRKDSSFKIQHNKNPDPSFSIPDSVFMEQEFLADNTGVYSYNNTYTWYVGNPVFATFKGYDVKMQIDVEGTFPVSMKTVDTTTGCSASDSASIKVLDPSSIDHPLPPASITVYPNPAHNSFLIEWLEADEFVWTLNNLQGQELIGQQVEGSTAQVDVVQLPTGVYILRTSNDRFHQSVLIQVLRP